MNRTPGAGGESPPDIDSEADLPSALRWRVVILSALVCLMDGWDMVVAPIGVPLMAEDWSVVPEGFSIALSAAVLGSGLGAAFLAPLGDRFGRRPLVLGSFAAVGLSSLAIAWTTDVVQLAALRLVTGLGMGTSLANALALVSEYAHPQLRSRIVACVYAMSALGGVVGGIVSPLAIDWLGWRGIYLVGGGIPLLLLLPLVFGLAESRRFEALRRGAAPSERAAAGDDVATSEGVARRLARLFSAPYWSATTLLWLLFLFSMFTNYIILSWLPTLMKLSGWSLEASVQAITAYSFGGLLGGFALGWLVDRGRTRFGLALGFATTGLAVAALPVVPEHLAIWMGLIVAMGAGVVGVSFALAAVAAAVYPTALRASGIGAAAAVGRIGATLAPLAGGALLASGFSAVQILTGLVVPMALGWLIVRGFSRTFEMAGPNES